MAFVFPVGISDEELISPSLIDSARKTRETNKIDKTWPHAGEMKRRRFQ